MPPLASAETPGPTGMDLLATPGGRGPAAAPGGQGAGPDEGLMQDLRTLKQQIDALGQKFPAGAPEIARLQQAFKAVIIKAGRAMSQQTPSAEALPMGGA